jgi:hypothetical protein
MDPRHYLTLAQQHVNCAKSGQGTVSPNGQAECRSAISRAYYAALNAAVEFLNSIGISVTETGDCHAVVKMGLGESNETDLKKVSSHLGTLGAERRRADYRMADTGIEDPDLADQLVTIALQTVNLLRQCKQKCQQDAGLSQMVAGTILAWAAQAGKQNQLWKTVPGRR